MQKIRISRIFFHNGLATSWPQAGDGLAMQAQHFFLHRSIFLHCSNFSASRQCKRGNAGAAIFLRCGNAGAAMQAQQCKRSIFCDAAMQVQQCRCSNKCRSAVTGAGGHRWKSSPHRWKSSPHRWKSSPHRWKSSDLTDGKVQPTDGKVHRSRAVAIARLMPSLILLGINRAPARFILLSKSVRLR